MTRRVLIVCGGRSFNPTGVDLHREGSLLTPEEQGQRAAREGWDWARDAAMANMSAEDYGRFLDGWGAVKDGGQ